MDDSMTGCETLDKSASSEQTDHHSNNGNKRREHADLKSFRIPLKRPKITAEGQKHAQQGTTSKYWSPATHQPPLKQKQTTKTTPKVKQKRDPPAMLEPIPWVSVPPRKSMRDETLTGEVKGQRKEKGEEQPHRKGKCFKLTLEEDREQSSEITMKSQISTVKTPKQRELSEKSMKASRKPADEGKKEELALKKVICKQPKSNPKKSVKHGKKSKESLTLQKSSRSKTKSQEKANRSSSPLSRVPMKGDIVRTAELGEVVKDSDMTRSAEPVELEEDESESESDWEEVADMPLLDPVIKEQSQVPDEPVEITLEAPDIMKKKRSATDPKDYIRLQMNKFKKASQINVHKVHLLCLLHEGMKMNRVCNKSILQAIGLSLVPVHLLTPTYTWQVSQLAKLVQWFSQQFNVDPTLRNKSSPLSESLLSSMELMSAASQTELVLIFIILCRGLGFDTRLVRSLQPATSKASDLVLKTPKTPSKSEIICLDSDEDSTQKDKSLSSKLSSIMKKSGSSKGKSKPKKKKVPTATLR